ncbi:MAG TPA: rhodanese-like domain-containing protein [Pyrinomonadaceae bacterium]|nr:rhodanese-like domain-containing protein [Pyrinomonadaceae bacterium]
MRSTFYLALIVAAAVVLAACNGMDYNANVANIKSIKPASGPETIYPDGARRVTTDELEAMLKNGEAIVVDVRNQASFDIGHIPGSRLIPAGEILNHLNELPRDKMIVTYCS